MIAGGCCGRLAPGVALLLLQCTLRTLLLSPKVLLTRLSLGLRLLLLFRAQRLLRLLHWAVCFVRVVSYHA